LTCDADPGLCAFETSGSCCLKLSRKKCGVRLIRCDWIAKITADESRATGRRRRDRGEVGAGSGVGRGGCCFGAAAAAIAAVGCALRCRNKS